MHAYTLNINPRQRLLLIAEPQVPQSAVREGAMEMVSSAADDRDLPWAWRELKYMGTARSKRSFLPQRLQRKYTG